MSTDTLMFDTDLSKFALRNKLWRELHMYVVLRDLLKHESGYSRRKYAAKHYAFTYKCSVATAYRRLDNLVKIGWVSESKDMVHVNGILRVKALVATVMPEEEFKYSRYMTEATVQVANASYSRTIDAFKVSILEGIKLEKVQRNLHRSRVRAKDAYSKDKVRGTARIAKSKCKISTRLVESRYDRSYAMHLVSSDLNISLASVCRAKKKAEDFGFSKYERRFVEGVKIRSYREVTQMLVLGQEYNPGRFKKVGNIFYAKDADRITFGIAFGKRKGNAQGRRAALNFNVFGQDTTLSVSSQPTGLQSFDFFCAKESDKVGIVLPFFPLGRM